MTFPGTLTAIYPSSSPSVLTPSQLTPHFPIPFKFLFYPALFFSPWFLFTFLISMVSSCFTFNLKIWMQESLMRENIQSFNCFYCELVCAHAHVCV